jgi:hypothetical protein
MRAFSDVSNQGMRRHVVSRKLVGLEREAARLIS